MSVYTLSKAGKRAIWDRTDKLISQAIKQKLVGKRYSTRWPQCTECSTRPNPSVLCRVAKPAHCEHVSCGTGCGK